MEYQGVCKTGNVRKKLWNLSSGLHCSIIGTCFRRSELSRLAKKRTLGLDYCSGDFKLHSALVGVAGVKSEKSRLLHRLLDKKFRLFVNKYNRINRDEDLERLWREDLAKGAIPGAYWALMTHPCAGKDLVHKVYGEVHMMGHDFFTLYRKDKENQMRLRTKVTLLEEVLESERQDYRMSKERLENEVAELRVALEESFLRSGKNETPDNRLDESREGNIDDDMVEKTFEMKQEIKELRNHRNRSLCQIDRLTARLVEKGKLLEATQNKVSELEEKASLLEVEKHDLKMEMASLESALLMKISTIHECSNCEDCDTDNCPGPGLCGKTVLYVGGQHKMIPHYRQMVEKLGGKFMHHDGGKEVAKAILPKMLNNADAVLCPVDCVSHYACNCVKQICKRSQKPFVMMRSSGLSSLARGLDEIVQ